jgi:hypothetical protein
MNYRERFKATTEHREINRVPFDLCGTSLTKIEQEETTEKLRNLLGLSYQYDGCTRSLMRGF